MNRTFDMHCIRLDPHGNSGVCGPSTASLGLDSYLQAITGAATGTNIIFNNPDWISDFTSAPEAHYENFLQCTGNLCHLTLRATSQNPVPLPSIVANLPFPPAQNIINIPVITYSPSAFGTASILTSGDVVLDSLSLGLITDQTFDLNVIYPR